MNVYEVIENHLQSYSMVNVAVSGITCSGKTTLANSIRKYFSKRYKVAIVSQDDYFKNLLDIPREKNGYLTDSIYAFWTEEFKNDVKQLLKNGIVTMPRYDIATNTRIDKSKMISVGRINVFEGLHTIHLLKELQGCINVFIDTEIETCLERRIARDTSKYGVPEARIRQYWEDCIKPMSERFIFPQKEDADIIISSKGDDSNDS